MMPLASLRWWFLLIPTGAFLYSASCSSVAVAPALAPDAATSDIGVADVTVALDAVVERDAPAPISCPKDHRRDLCVLPGSLRVSPGFTCVPGAYSTEENIGLPMVDPLGQDPCQVFSVAVSSIELIDGRGANPAYFEVLFSGAPGSTPSSFDFDWVSKEGRFVRLLCQYRTDGMFRCEGLPDVSVPRIKDGDVLGVALNSNQSTVWFALNGVPIQGVCLGDGSGLPIPKIAELTLPDGGTLDAGPQLGPSQEADYVSPGLTQYPGSFAVQIRASATELRDFPPEGFSGGWYRVGTCAGPP
jgi:hypothetical protein